MKPLLLILLFIAGCSSCRCPRVYQVIPAVQQDDAPQWDGVHYIV